MRQKKRKTKANAARWLRLVSAREDKKTRGNALTNVIDTAESSASLTDSTWSLLRPPIRIMCWLWLLHIKTLQLLASPGIAQQLVRRWDICFELFIVKLCFQIALDARMALSTAARNATLTLAITQAVLISIKMISAIPLVDKYANKLRTFLFKIYFL